MILAIKTDSFDAELYILDMAGNIQDSLKWHAGRKLSIDLLSKIEELLSRNNLEMQQVGGVVIYEGPGSFTGLRIGVSVANAIGYGLQTPVVGSSGVDWLDKGAQALGKQDKFIPVVPKYGSEPHITQPKK